MVSAVNEHAVQASKTMFMMKFKKPFLRVGKTMQKGSFSELAKKEIFFRKILRHDGLC